MRFIKYLQEKYTGIDGSSNKYSVYENPTPLDFKMALEEKPKVKSVRFMADIESKKIWIANGDTIHLWMWNGCVKKNAKTKKGYDGPEMLSGEAEKIGNKWYMIRSDSIKEDRSDDEIKELFSYNWKWVNKYIIVDNWIKIFKKERGI